MVNKKRLSNAYFIKPYRSPLHSLTGFWFGFMKRTVCMYINFMLGFPRHETTACIVSTTSLVMQHSKECKPMIQVVKASSGAFICLKKIVSSPPLYPNTPRVLSYFFTTFLELKLFLNYIEMAWIYYLLGFLFDAAFSRTYFPLLTYFAFSALSQRPRLIS